MMEASYGDIVFKFKRAFPEIHVDDYRPADGLPNTLIVWAGDSVLLVYYDESFDYVFILGQTPKCPKRP